jgi:hypothetical protein
MESHQINNREEQTSVSLTLTASHHQKIEESHLKETNIIFIHHQLSYYKRILCLNRHSNSNFNPNVINFGSRAKPTFKMTNNLD